MKIQSCAITYSPAPLAATATLVELSYNKECSTQMVTVCQPGYQNSYGHGSYQHCKV